MFTGHNWGLCRKCGKDHGAPPWLGRHRSEETRVKMSEIVKEQWEDPEMRAKMLAGLNTPETIAKRVATQNTPEVLSTTSKNSTAMWADPEIRAKIVARMNTPEAIANNRKRGRARWVSGRFNEVNLGDGVGGKRADLNNQFFRSTWEANLARIMNFWGIKWEYEAKRIPYNNGTKTHMIDFYLPETNSYLDIYSYLDKRHLEEFYGVYESGLSVQLIGPDVYRDLEKEFKDKLPFWENGRKKAKTLNT